MKFLRGGVVPTREHTVTCPKSLPLPRRPRPRILQIGRHPPDLGGEVSFSTTVGATTILIAPANAAACGGCANRAIGVIGLDLRGRRAHGKPIRIHFGALFGGRKVSLVTLEALRLTSSENHARGGARGSRTRLGNSGRQEGHDFGQVLTL